MDCYPDEKTIQYGYDRPVQCCKADDYNINDNYCMSTPENPRNPDVWQKFRQDICLANNGAAKNNHLTTSEGIVKIDNIPISSSETSIIDTYMKSSGDRNIPPQSCEGYKSKTKYVCGPNNIEIIASFKNYQQAPDVLANGHCRKKASCCQTEDQKDLNRQNNEVADWEMQRRMTQDRQDQRWIQNRMNGPDWTWTDPSQKGWDRGGPSDFEADGDRGNTAI